MTLFWWTEGEETYSVERVAEWPLVVVTSEGWFAAGVTLEVAAISLEEETRVAAMDA